MLNEFLWVVLLLLNFVGIIFAYRFFGKTGLFAWVAIAVILANIQVLKTVQLFGYVTALGNIIYGSIFLASDILNENHGRKEAQKAVLLGFFVLVFVTLFMQLTLQFIPDESDFISPALQDIFGFFPRIMIASIIAYIVSQSYNTLIYESLKKRSKGKKLWLRNNVSTFISQFLDNAVFTFIAFVGLFGVFGWEQVFEWNVIWQIFILSIVMKYFVAVLDTMVVYYAKSLKKVVKDQK